MFHAWLWRKLALRREQDREYWTTLGQSPYLQEVPDILRIVAHIQHNVRALTQHPWMWLAIGIAVTYVGCTAGTSLMIFRFQGQSCTIVGKSQWLWNGYDAEEYSHITATTCTTGDASPPPPCWSSCASFRQVDMLHLMSKTKQER